MKRKSNKQKLEETVEKYRKFMETYSISELIHRTEITLKSNKEILKD